MESGLVVVDALDLGIEDELTQLFSVFIPALLQLVELHLSFVVGIELGLGRGKAETTPLVELAQGFAWYVHSVVFLDLGAALLDSQVSHVLEALLTHQSQL